MGGSALAGIGNFRYVPPEFPARPVSPEAIELSYNQGVSAAKTLGGPYGARLERASEEFAVGKINTALRYYEALEDADAALPYKDLLGKISSRA